MQALWEAVLNLLTNLPHLQDRCVDYLDYVFGYFHPSVDVELQLVALRVTCILATNALCAENIAKFRLVKNLLPLLGTLRDRGSIPQVQDTGPASVDVRERSADNARGRSCPSCWTSSVDRRRWWPRSGRRAASSCC